MKTILLMMGCLVCISLGLVAICACLFGCVGMIDYVRDIVKEWKDD